MVRAKGIDLVRVGARVQITVLVGVSVPVRARAQDL